MSQTFGQRQVLTGDSSSAALKECRKRVWLARLQRQEREGTLIPRLSTRRPGTHCVDPAWCRPDARAAVGCGSRSGRVRTTGPTAVSYAGSWIVRGRHACVRCASSLNQKWKHQTDRMPDSGFALVARCSRACSSMPWDQGDGHAR